MIFKGSRNIIAKLGKKLGQFVVLLRGKELVQATGPVLQFHEQFGKGTYHSALVVESGVLRVAEDGITRLFGVVLSHAAQRIQAVGDGDDATQPAQFLYHERLLFQQLVQDFFVFQVGRARLVRQFLLLGKELFHGLDRIAVNTGGILELADLGVELLQGVDDLLLERTGLGETRGDDLQADLRQGSGDAALAQKAPGLGRDRTEFPGPLGDLFKHGLVALEERVHFGLGVGHGKNRVFVGVVQFERCGTRGFLLHEHFAKLNRQRHLHPTPSQEVTFEQQSRQHFLHQCPGLFHQHGPFRGWGINGFDQHVNGIRHLLGRKQAHALAHFLEVLVQRNLGEVVVLELLQARSQHGINHIDGQLPGPRLPVLLSQDLAVHFLG